MTQSEHTTTGSQRQRENRLRREAASFFGVAETAELRYRPRSRMGDKPAPGVTPTWQPFVPAALFSTMAETSTKEDVQRALAMSYDSDICDYPDTPASWGQTRDEKKKYLYSASEEEVIEWMRSSGYVESLVHTLQHLGHPTPDTVLYTGHGVLLVSRLPSDMALKDATLWRYADLCRAWKDECNRLIESGYEYIIDPHAKDLGTRLCPLPGHRHRNSNKMVRLLGRNQPENDFESFFGRLLAQTPTPVPKTRASTVPRSRAGGGAGGALQRKQWPPEWGALPAEGVDTTCPSCPAEAVRGARRYGAVLHCFRCSTQWYVDDRQRDWSIPMSALREPEHVEVKLDERGYAQFDGPISNFSVLKLRTGSGKTHAISEFVRNFSGAVQVVSPTSVLSANLAETLGLPHAAAGSKISLTQGSNVCCLARFVETTKRMTNEQIAQCAFIFDESEGQLRQLNSDILRTNPETLEAVVRATALGAAVIFSDAHQGLQTDALITQANEWRAAEGLEKRTFTRYVSEKHVFDFIYVMEAKKGSQTISSHDVHLNIISERVQQGQKIAAWAYSKAEADAVGATLRARHPDRSVLVVTSPETEDARVDFASATLQQADVLVYNNAMGSGVSLDAGHYDQVHILAGNINEIDADMIEQALHRDRKAALRPIMISGNIRDCPKDYEKKCDPKWQLEQAVTEFLAEEGVAKKSCISLLSSWHFSRAAKWMGWQQACARAQAALSGREWGLTWLLGRHRVSPLHTDYDADAREVGRDVRAAKKGKKKAQAVKAVVAAPCTEERAKEIIEGDLPQDEAELAAYRKQQVIHLVGDLQQFPEPVVARLMDRQVQGKLAQEVHRTAMAALILAGPDSAKKAVQWHKLRTHKTEGDTSRSTIVAARRGLVEAEQLAQLLGVILACTRTVDCFALSGAAQKKHCSLLRRAGIEVRCRQTSRGANSRIYSVTRESVLLALRIAEARIEKINAAEY